MSNEQGFFSENQKRIFVIVQIFVIVAIIGFMGNAMQNAFRAFYRAYAIQKVSKQIHSIVQTIYISNITSNSESNDLGNTLIISALLPDSMIKNGKLIDAWGKEASLLQVNIKNSNDGYALSYFQLNQDTCIDLITKVGGSDRPQNLAAITTGQTTIRKFPVSLADAIMACQARSNVAAFLFTFG